MFLVFWSLAPGWKYCLMRKMNDWIFFPSCETPKCILGELTRFVCSRKPDYFSRCYYKLRLSFWQEPDLWGGCRALQLDLLSAQDLYFGLWLWVWCWVQLIQLMYVFSSNQAYKYNVEQIVLGLGCIALQCLNYYSIIFTDCESLACIEYCYIQPWWTCCIRESVM